MAAALQGWHPGETKLHNLLHFPSSISTRYTAIESQLREQHRIFHTSYLPFIPLTAIDKDGRPWAGIAAGRSGEIGFVSSPDLETLVFGVRVWAGEPLVEILQSWNGKGDGEGTLTAGLGIEFSTRRRNKFAGAIRDVRAKGEGEYVVTVEVTEALGNCPKYINTRHLIPHPKTNPAIIHQVAKMPGSSRLPIDVTDMIKSADTTFIASIYRSDPATTSRFPSHTGMNARSGLPGFIRVRPSDCRTVVLPDYSGNRFLSSLGNIEASGLAGFTIVDFESGDILYLTGKAKNVVGEEACTIIKRHSGCITLLEVTGYTLVRDALPVRQAPGSVVGRSPYSPNIKYLVEEAEVQGFGGTSEKARLQSARQLSSDLAVFRFKVVPNDTGGVRLSIRPGQAVVLDFMDWLGPPQYRHMADNAPGSINDDRVRTWTVSGAHEGSQMSWFELTMREMKGGAVTGALFEVLRKHPQEQGRLVEIEQSVVADIVGVTGDFVLSDKEINALWVAGGIGITPFLAMLEALGSREAEGQGKSTGDILFALSTKEPDVMFELLQNSLENAPMGVKVKIDLFTRSAVRADIGEFQTGKIQVSVHEGRIGPQYWKTVPTEKDVFICGPNDFGDAAVEGLRAVGVPNKRIHREGFY
ncbi:putative oxidoreductase, FAD-binding [Aspergillus foveolatus]|uniref:putative oxidoreductase, FAD-binding n=1 Tax=Aspergillus foveolatus TaxID=210207 RepID=UPI003CCCCC2E